jgi:hypothetical protein
MRWITIPEPIDFIHPETDEVAGKATFAQYIRGLRADARIFQGLGHLEAYELSSSLSRAKAGDVVPVEEDSWRALAEVAKAPKTLAPAFVYAPDAHRFVKAVTEAPSKKPEP